MLIACRIVQGIGVGGLSALAQIVMAAMISPRERGRYSGYLGATFAVATVGGPLLGGVITDTSWLGWRWCFYVGVPFAVIALIVLQKTLHLPVVKRDVKVDWAGAFFVAAAVSLLLVWVTFAGDKYDWISWQTYAMVGGSIVLGLIFVLVESKVREPIIPLRLFRNRTITLASLASLFVGVAMFTGTVFFSQYFQLARDKSPTMSGVMTIPMIGGLFVSSTVSGQFITRTGRWKAWLVSGGVLVTAGLGLLGTIRYDTDYWKMAIFMALLGLGIGMMMQNLVLCTQNQVDPSDLGSASSTVTFFRSLGGAVGVSALGAVMSHRISHYVTDGVAALDPKYQAALSGSGSSTDSIPDLAKLPAPVRTLMESAYGHGIADVFLIAGALAAVAFLITLFIKEVPLKTKGALAQAAGEDSPAEAPVEAAPRGSCGSDDCRAHAQLGHHHLRHRDRSRRHAAAVRRRHPDPPRGVLGRLRRHPGPRLRARQRERAGPAGRGHADLARGTAAGPVGDAGRRLVRGRGTECGVVRPDRLRRRLPAAGVHGAREQRAGGLRRPPQRHQRAERARAGRGERGAGQGRDGDRHRCAGRSAGHRYHR